MLYKVVHSIYLIFISTNEIIRSSQEYFPVLLVMLKGSF